MNEIETLPAKDLTDDQIRSEIERIGKLWDDMMSNPEFEGHGGSPGEWMIERLMELETARDRRAAK